MQYHLDTIPVWAAMEQKNHCPLCTLHSQAERTEIDHFLGESVMEPSTRIHVNELGFCGAHEKKLFAESNKLGHALLTDSYCIELAKKLDKLSKKADSSGRPWQRLRSANENGGLTAIGDELTKSASACVICDAIDTHMNRYTYTLLFLWKTDPAFVAIWEKSQGACLPHTAALLHHAQKHLPSNKHRKFAASALGLLSQALAKNHKDLQWFIQKHDYRNQDKPWGSGKDALERTLAALHDDFAPKG